MWGEFELSLSEQIKSTDHHHQSSAQTRVSIHIVPAIEVSLWVQHCARLGTPVYSRFVYELVTSSLVDTNSLHVDPKIIPADVSKNVLRVHGTSVVPRPSEEGGGSSGGSKISWRGVPMIQLRAKRARNFWSHAHLGSKPRPFRSFWEKLSILVQSICFWTSLILLKHAKVSHSSIYI